MDTVRVGVRMIGGPTACRHPREVNPQRHRVAPREIKLATSGQGQPMALPITLADSSGDKPVVPTARPPVLYSCHDTVDLPTPAGPHIHRTGTRASTATPVTISDAATSRQRIFPDHDSRADQRQPGGSRESSLNH